jgi:hypothetical protein
MEDTLYAGHLINDPEFQATLGVQAHRTVFVGRFLLSALHQKLSCVTMLTFLLCMYCGTGAQVATQLSL